jgi:hypothetical protein
VHQDPDWVLMAPDAPYEQHFPDDESTSSVSASESSNDCEDETESEDLASDDAATDMSDADGSEGDWV